MPYSCLQMLAWELGNLLPICSWCQWDKALGTINHLLIVDGSRRAIYDWAWSSSATSPGNRRLGNDISETEAGRVEAVRQQGGESARLAALISSVVAGASLTTGRPSMGCE
jgi:hypothetical protein